MKVKKNNILRIFWNKTSVFLFILPFFVLFSYIFHPSLNIFSLSIFNEVKAETIEQKEARLQKELEQIEREQKETEAFLNKTKQEASSLSRDIAILNAQIKSAQLKIKEKNILIEKLGKDISQKNKDISNLNGRIETGKESLSKIIKKSYEMSEYDLAEMVLKNESLSGLLASLEEYDQINRSMLDLFEDIRDSKQKVEVARDILDKRKNSETDARMVIEEEKKTIEKKEKEKNYLLTATKGQEKAYESILAEKRQKAAQIRAALFALRDSDAIPFDKAFEYATLASQKTGVRPAFILAILTQESALGANVGSCYLTDPNTGSGVSAKSGNLIKNVMKPERDVTPFIQITKNLGRDPYKTLVSCPQSIGYGGAMGPAQFIPSTWNLFVGRIASALGVTTPDPWNPKDAFVASAIFLKDLGANVGGYTAERNAACRYYSGSVCKVGHINSTYGDQVMYKAYNIQENMINVIQGL